MLGLSSAPVASTTRRPPGDQYRERARQAADAIVFALARITEAAARNCARAAVGSAVERADMPMPPRHRHTGTVRHPGEPVAHVRAVIIPRRPRAIGAKLTLAIAVVSGAHGAETACRPPQGKGQCKLRETRHCCIHPNRPVPANPVLLPAGRSRTSMINAASGAKCEANVRRGRQPHGTSSRCVR